MADVSFSKPEVVISGPRIEFANELWYADRLWPSQETARDSPNPKPEVVLRRRGCHLKTRQDVITLPLATHFDAIRQADAE